MGGFVVATLNVRNRADRWRERAPLLVEQLVALDPDLISVQEVRRIPDQARWIAREASRGPPGRAPVGGPKGVQDRAQAALGGAGGAQPTSR